MTASGKTKELAFNSLIEVLNQGQGYIPNIKE
jgi:hypothetical protein